MLSVIASVNTLSSTLDRAGARSAPVVLQLLTSMDVENSLLNVDLELSTRHRRTPNIDWLLRLDLSPAPASHEQWHGQVHCVGGHLNIEVSPRQWPTGGQRWSMRLWLRDPDSDADWELVETRPLP
ncbi:MAG: hypothetical protein AB7E72_09645 [Lysobacterales bacterium]